MRVNNTCKRAVSAESSGESWPELYPTGTLLSECGLGLLLPTTPKGYLVPTEKKKTSQTGFIVSE
ncbi:hypothetical protein MUG91_G7n37 [Manis pentadactyla]|nr:hypothetical protein MUG91_G7n37 [Manis pentadactyla]